MIDLFLLEHARSRMFETRERDSRAGATGNGGVQERNSGPRLPSREMSAGAPAAAPRRADGCGRSSEWPGSRHLRAQLSCTVSMLPCCATEMCGLVLDSEY